MRASRFAGLLVAAMAAAFTAEAPPLVLSHSWIVVTTGAPERKALERAGFRIAPGGNRHDGQGTASVTVELLNGFLELIYPDPTVPVSPALQAGAEKFRLKSAWRETGYSRSGSSSIAHQRRRRSSPLRHGKSLLIGWRRTPLSR